MRHKSLEDTPRTVEGTAGSQSEICGERSTYNSLFKLVAAG